MLGYYPSSLQSGSSGSDVSGQIGDAYASHYHSWWGGPSYWMSSANPYQTWGEWASDKLVGESGSASDRETIFNNIASQGRGGGAYGNNLNHVNNLYLLKQYHSKSNPLNTGLHDYPGYPTANITGVVAQSPHFSGAGTPASKYFDAGYTHPGLRYRGRQEERARERLIRKRMADLRSYQNWVEECGIVACWVIGALVFLWITGLGAALNPLGSFGFGMQWVGSGHHDAANNHYIPDRREQESTSYSGGWGWPGFAREKQHTTVGRSNSPYQPPLGATDPGTYGSSGDLNNGFNLGSPPPPGYGGFGATSPPSSAYYGNLNLQQNHGALGNTNGSGGPGPGQSTYNPLHGTFSPSSSSTYGSKSPYCTQGGKGCSDRVPKNFGDAVGRAMENVGKGVNDLFGGWFGGK